jgi:hypothetical protein
VKRLTQQLELEREEKERLKTLYETLREQLRQSELKLGENEIEGTKTNARLDSSIRTLTDYNTDLQAQLDRK